MKSTFNLLPIFLLICGVTGADANEVKTVMEGDSVTLNPDPTQIQGFIQIKWWFGGSVIAQTNGNDISYPTQTEIFRDRLKLDQTASLTIKNMRSKHSGDYKLQIDQSNGTSRFTFRVTVYESLSVIDAGGAEIKSVSVMEGDPVTLQTDVTEPHGDELIVWRFGDEGKLIVKHDIEAKSSPLYDTDERFRDRLKLDQTGSLTITNIRTRDSGLYTVKISSSKQTLYKRFSVTIIVPGLSPGAVAGIVAVLLVFSAAAAAGFVYYRRKISELERQKVKRVSVKEGESVTLNTDVTEIHRDDLIQWRFGDENSLIAEIKGGTISIYVDVLGERFRDRLKLDEKTGSLIITNTRTTDSGLYELKISKDHEIKYIKKFSVSVCVESVSVMEGDPVTLNTGVTEIHRDDLIEWRFGYENSLIAEIKGGTISTYDDVADGRFRDRLKLDKKTGSLTITDTRTTDSGLYELKISKDSKIKYIKKFSVSVCAERVSVMEGDPVTLNTGVTEIHRDDLIQWRFGDEGPLIAEIKEGTISTYDDGPDGIFKDRLKLDKTTGSLTITNTEIKHSGVYKLQIRSSSGDSYKKFIVILRMRNISVEEGEPVTLEPDTEIQKDDQILWKFGDQGPIIAQIKGGKGETHDVPDERFKNRLILDEKTGSLIIKDSTFKHAGLYKLQIISNRGTTNKTFFISVFVRNISVEEGEDVTLEPVTEIQKDDLILWKFGYQENLIAQIKGGKGETHDVPDERFRDRLKLDEKTGSLTITNMRIKQSGDYRLQIISSRGTANKIFVVTVSGSDEDAPPRSSSLKALKSVIPESTTVEVDTPLLSDGDKVNEQQETSSL